MKTTVARGSLGTWQRRMHEGSKASRWAHGARRTAGCGGCMQLSLWDRRHAPRLCTWYQRNSHQLGVVLAGPAGPTAAVTDLVPAEQPSAGSRFRRTNEPGTSSRGGTCGPCTASGRRTTRPSSSEGLQLGSRCGSQMGRPAIGAAKWQGLRQREAGWGNRKNAAGGSVNAG